MIEKISINKNDTAVWPIFFDYDLMNKKPRGYSGRLELFSFGTINRLLLDTKYLDNIVLVKLNSILFKSGVFLVDYSKILNDVDKFINKIFIIGFRKVIYMAESHQYNIEDYFRFYKNIFVKFFIFE